MNGKSSALIGLTVGLALCAALFVPDAHRPALVAQGLGDLLAAHGELALAAAAARDEGTVPAPGLVDPGRALFAAVRAAHGGPEEAGPIRLAVSFTVDGASPDPADVDAFQRAVGSRVNALNAELGDGPDAPLFQLLETGAAATGGAVGLALAVTTAGDDVRLTAVVDGPGGSHPVRPPEEGLVVPGGETLPTAWSIPGRLALLPPVLAILVALVFRRTLLALFLGILSGATAVVWLGGEQSLLAVLPTGLADVFRVYLMGELRDSFRIEIIGFVIALVAMVGVMSRSGGVQGLVQLLLGFARTVRSTLLVTWGMGLLIFFDDYANCLLVGNTMRPLTDRLRVSREKLAYVVDSTAAPIAGVSILSTWIAFEVSTFEAHLPGAGITENAYEVFLRTIPFRYYCLFTLMFVGLTILLRRDFGPMARAEERARTTGQLVREGGVPMVSDEATRIEPHEAMPRRWIDAGLPILLVLLATLGTIYVDGGGPDMPLSELLTLEGSTAVLFEGSGGKPIFLGATAGFILAVFLAGSRALRIGMAGGSLLVTAALFAGPWGGSGAESLYAELTQALEGSAFVSGGYDQGLVGPIAGYVVFALVFSLGAVITGAIANASSQGPGDRPHLPLAEIRSASLSSIQALFFAVAILFHAWMIGKVCQDLSTADYLVALLSGAVSPAVLPVLLFVAACLVAFATGSSWSTMSILLPNVVALAAAVGESGGLGALAMVVLCIGAVLEGSIFGDHCSPISDTTVLSSVSSASDHVDHVRTQAPYALTTAGLAITLGYLPSVLVDDWNSLWSLGLGGAAIVVLLLVIGRTVPDAPADAAVGAG